MASTPVPIAGANTIAGFNITVPFTTTDQFTFSFPYLSQDDFKIEVNSETVLDAADYEFVSDYLIQLTTVGRDKLNALYTSGVIDLIIYRATTLTVRLTDFQNGANLTDTELDLQSNQTFFLIQEAYDTFLTGTLGKNPVSSAIDAEGAEIIDIGDPTGLTSAVNLTTLYNNVITPLYAENGIYRAGRMVFNAAGDLIRANKDVEPAPAVLVVADWDDVLTAAQIAQIATNTADIATNAADILTNIAAISLNTAKVSADGLVTTHSDVTDAGSGIIISVAERTAIGTNTTGISDHLADATDAHTASAITNVPSGNLVSTDAQAALNELQTELDNAATSADLVAHDVDTSVHGVVEVLGRTESQVMTNKDIDGGIATNTNRITVPKATKATLDALDRKQATIVYASDEDKLYKDDGSTLTELGSGSGGGGLDTFFTEDHETNGIDNYTTGNNATFDNGGTVSGALSLDTVTHLNGTQSLKFFTSPTSLNDWIKSEAITVGEKHQENTIGFEYYLKYDGSDDDIRFVIYDNTNSVELTTEVEFIKASSGSKRFSAQSYIPNGVTSISYGWHVVGGVTSKSLLIDDITGTSSPFVAKDSIVTETYRTSDVLGLGSTATKIPYYKATPDKNTIVGLGTLENDSINGLRFTATSKCTVDVSMSYAGAGIDYFGITLNATNTTSLLSVPEANILAINYVTAANLPQSCSASIEMDVGDILQPHVHNLNAPATLNSERHSFLLVATAEADQIVAYNSRNAANLVVEGAGNGGTALTINVTDMDFTEVTDTGFGGGNFNGTQFTVPDTGLYFIKGCAAFTAAGNREIHMYIGGTYSKTLTGYTTADVQEFSYIGNFTKEDVVSFRIGVNTGTLTNTINEHYLNITKIGVGDLLGVPKPLVGYLEDVKASGTNGGTASVTYATRTLNTESGDFSKFGTLASNQFTLDAGTYDFDFDVPCYEGTALSKAKLVRDPSGSPSDEKIGTTARPSASGAYNWSNIRGRFTITSSTTFEIQMKNTVATANVGWGIPAGFGDDEIYTNGKITKLN